MRSEGLIVVSVIRLPRRVRRCERCHGLIAGPQVRLFGTACSGDPPTTLYLHPKCAAKSQSPRVVAASREAGADAELQQPTRAHSSAEEHPRPKRGVGGSNPPGRSEVRRGVGRRSTNEHAGPEDNPITAGIARRPGRPETQGDKSEVPAVGPQQPLVGSSAGSSGGAVLSAASGEAFPPHSSTTGEAPPDQVNPPERSTQ